MAELLAPAGNIEALSAAIGEGADAVYVGLKSFNARLRSTNFAWNQFEAAVNSVHRLGKKIFVTVNTVIEEREMERMYRFLAYLAKIGPDALIVQDFGVVKMIRECFPSLRIHASTQMNIASAKAVNTMARNGVSRIVLARELSLEEIRDIRYNTSAELEVFVHGALCVSESGLCLFSSYLGGKSANRGMCTQACRRLYTAEVGGGSEQGYYFSPHDLQLIDRIPDLLEAGVDSFKIEGRMKSADYVGGVVSAYRYMLDHWQEDKKGSIAVAKRMLATDFARTKTSYWFMEAKNDSDTTDFLNPKQSGGTGIFLGTIDRVRVSDGIHYGIFKGGSYEPEVGDSIRLHKKDDTGRESHKVRTIDVHDGKKWFDIPEGFSLGDAAYLIQIKSMSRRYSSVLPHDLSSYRLQPGGQELPFLQFPPAKTTSMDAFPEGLYVQVSTLEDMYVVQSERPTRLIVLLNSDTTKALLPCEEHNDEKVAIPFSKKEIIIALDPFMPQHEEASLADKIAMLVQRGYRHWILNNPAHISLLKSFNVNMIAGSYLYTFNRWALAWLMNNHVNAFITPLENSRQNLEKTFDEAMRKQAFVTIFSYPALFRIRCKLPEVYDFHYFNDKEGETFKALSSDDGSFVLPEKPFSLIDKAPFLQTAGFKRFIIDFSYTKVKKNEYRRIVTAFRKGQVLDATSRFNWKEGFYSPEKIEAYIEQTARAKETAAAAAAAAHERGNNNRSNRNNDNSRSGRSTEFQQRGDKKTSHDGQKTFAKKRHPGGAPDSRKRAYSGGKPTQRKSFK